MTKIELVQAISQNMCPDCTEEGNDCGEDPNTCSRIECAIAELDLYLEEHYE